MNFYFQCIMESLDARRISQPFSGFLTFKWIADDIAWATVIGVGCGDY